MEVARGGLKVRVASTGKAQLVAMEAQAAERWGEAVTALGVMGQVEAVAMGRRKAVVASLAQVAAVAVVRAKVMAANMAAM